CPGALRALPSFPTRRSSDLSPVLSEAPVRGGRRFVVSGARDTHTCAHTCGELHGCKSTPVHTPVENYIGVIQVSSAYFATARARSEEHTSELQSRENLVCRL